MIIGGVTSDLEAIVTLSIQGPAGQQVDIDVLVDTGFDGGITLPPALIAQLGLAWQRRGRATLGDGTDCYFNVYEGIVIWDGKPRRVQVDEADTIPLLGMSLLEGSELTMQVRPQGQVTITVMAMP
jgi:clan AA aspartic protease